MDIQALRDQAKEARQRAELQFFTMAAHGDSLKKQQELQKDLLPKKSSYSAGDRSPGGRGLEMRRLQAEQMEQHIKDMKRQMASRTWYDGSTLRPEQQSSKLDEKEKGDPLEEIFQFAKHAPPPPKELVKPEDTQAKAPPAPPSTRPKFPELSTFELPTTSAQKAKVAQEEPSMKLFSKPPPSFQKMGNMSHMDMDMEEEEGDEDPAAYPPWMQDPTPPAYAFPDVYAPPPPPPLFQSMRKSKHGGDGEEEPPKSKHRSKKKKSKKSKKEAQQAREAKEKEQADEIKEDKENKAEESEVLKNVSEHSKRVASVHELEKERDALRQDIALLAAAVQNRNQAPPAPPAPVIVQYPMPQPVQQETKPNPLSAPGSDLVSSGASEGKKGESSNEDLMRMFNSAFNSGDIELKKYLQHEVLRLRKRNEFLEGERVDLLTMKAEYKRMTEDFLSAKASLDTISSENAKMREENSRLQGLNDILAEEVKRGGDGTEDSASLEAELASLRVMNHKLKVANKDLLEEQKNLSKAENQLLDKIESLETTKTFSPVKKLEAQIASLLKEREAKEEEFAELQERAEQMDRLREENANLELQLVEVKMRKVQEIPLNAKLKDAADEIKRLTKDNTSLAAQLEAMGALNDEVKATKKALESKCAMYEKALQEANLLTSGITMYDTSGKLAEKNKKEMKSAVKDYLAIEYGLPQLRSGQSPGPEATGGEGGETSPARSPHGKIIMQTGKENIQAYLVKASTRRDFMRMGKNESVKTLLARSDDLEIEFSDLVFKREASGLLKKFILVITKKGVYLLTSDQYACEWKCTFSDLFSMGWDSQIVEDLTFKVAQNTDMCIQSPRRDIVIGTILTLLEDSQSSFQVKKDFSSFSLLRAV